MHAFLILIKLVEFAQQAFTRFFLDLAGLEPSSSSSFRLTLCPKPLLHLQDIHVNPGKVSGTGKSETCGMDHLPVQMTETEPCSGSFPDAKYPPHNGHCWACLTGEFHSYGLMFKWRPMLFCTYNHLGLHHELFFKRCEFLCSNWHYCSQTHLVYIGILIGGLHLNTSICLPPPIPLLAYI